MQWLKYDFHLSDILRETEKSYLIAISKEFSNGTYIGECVWIPKKLARFNRATDTYNAVIGDSFTIKVLEYEADFRSGGDSVKTYQESAKEINAQEFTNKANAYQESRKAERTQIKQESSLTDKIQAEHYTIHKKRKAYEASKDKLSEAQAKQRLASIQRTEAKIKELKAQKSELIKPTTLKPIKHSTALERQASKDLRAFTERVNKSIKHFTLAQFNKYNRGEINNISTALRIKFNSLTEQWEATAREFAKDYASKQSKSIGKYVEANYNQQGEHFKLKGLSANTKQIMQAQYLENIALIKSIPRDIIKRYQSALYNAVANFDSGEINKLAKQIGQISTRRAKTIARDQTAKAIESFSNARARDLGFTHYQWLTSKDERVSKAKGGHRQLDGRIYSYDSASAIIDSYENKGHPAQRVNCRCIAIPIQLLPNQELRLIKDSISGDYYELLQK